jgi:hypothetical protein
MRMDSKRTLSCLRRGTYRLQRLAWPGCISRTNSPLPAQSQSRISASKTNVLSNIIMHIKSRTNNLIQGATVIAVSALLCGGCASSEKQVQKAAKDWCMTIRGSQVIPVYPLTEELQPGDIFLVQVPIDQQQKLYKQNGFLPLDNALGRINPDGYQAFYGHSFFPTNESVVLPRDWIRPLGVGIYTNHNGTNMLAWQAAPRVAFPSYSFSVQNGAGLSLAVPVQGVPVGLSLLASDAASGCIQIQDARTMGVDTLSLYRQLKGWAKTNIAFLGNFGPSPESKRTNYVRVITRVFASGRMIVSLKDASNRSGGLDVGVPKAVNLLQPQLPSGQTTTPEAALSNYTNAMNAISEMVKAAGSAVDAAGKALPGSSLRLAAASARSVSLDETFDPPVILGYLGFDCVIDEGGRLGPPMPTYANLHPALAKGIERHFALGLSAKTLRSWANNPKPADIPAGKTARDVTKEREGKITLWIQGQKADYTFADLLYRDDLESDRQQFLQDKGMEYNINQ